MLTRVIRIAALLLATFAAAAGSDSLELLHLTDTHLIDLRGVEAGVAAQRKMFEPAAARLTTFLRSLAVKPPDFLLITGDLVDGFEFQGAAGGMVSGQIEPFRAAIQNSPVPVFLSLGNHDVQRYTAMPRRTSQQVMKAPRPRHGQPGAPPSQTSAKLLTTASERRSATRCTGF